MSAYSLHSADSAALKLGTVTDLASIGEHLRKIWVRFERWPIDMTLPATAEHEAILNAYREPLERLKQQYGFQSIDVISVKPDHPDKEALRHQFLFEHTHNDFEVRYFVEGRGLFHLHVGDEVHALLCEQGDLVSVPSNMPHWFDMGENPDFTCIRLFTRHNGWVAQFSADPIAARFPSLEQYLAAL